MTSAAWFHATPARLLTAGILLALSACAARSGHETPVAVADAKTKALRAEVQTIVVIYAENRAFDNLYGNFPGAAGLGDVLGPDGRPLPAYQPQRDRDGSLLPRLPQTWGGVTAAGYTPVVTQAESGGLPNAPFSVEQAFAAQSGVTLGRDSGFVSSFLRAPDADRRRQERSICRLG